MRNSLFVSLIVGCLTMSTPGQESGNRNYNPNAGRRVAPNTGLVYANGEVLIDAYVLINLPADEFVAVFGVSQEAPTAVESNQKVNNLIDQFLTAADKLGVPRSNTFVDFITQNRVYNFVQAGDNTIREQLQGFETKKNVAVRYKDRGVLEKLVTAASQASIFDLIKVDYVINDLSKIRNRLFDEAARIVKQKEETYTRALGLAIKRGALLQETYDTHYPGELYQTYTAFESGAVDSNYTTNTRVIRERKSRTSYLEPLDRSAFDAVIGAAGIEPMVQCTLYMKVSYSIAR